jgi:hypothetical protein
VAGQRCVQFPEKDIGQRRALTVFEDLFSDLGQLDVGVLGDLPQHREAVARGYPSQDGQDADGLVDDGVRARACCSCRFSARNRSRSSISSSADADVD